MIKNNYSVGVRLKDKLTGELATITEITERGFIYKWDKIQSFIPRMGLSFVGGEVYLDQCGKYGFSQFELASEELTPAIKYQQEYLCKFIDQQVIT